MERWEVRQLQIVYIVDGTFTAKWNPTVVQNIPPVTAISVGYDNTYSNVMVKVSGGILVWGGNSNGRLSDGTSSNRNTPYNITNVYSFSAGSWLSVFLIPNSNISCFGNTASSPLVCSGNGSCVAQDTCICATNYFGANCSQLLICNGVIGNLSVGCSYRGQCTLNGCVCNSGYTGSSCATPICFGVAATSSSTCSGNGYCREYNYCQCYPGYSGANCSSISAAGTLYTSGSSSGNAGILGDSGVTSRTTMAPAGLHTGKTYHYVYTFGINTIVLNVATNQYVGWGYNGYGLLGLGSTSVISTPTPTFVGLYLKLIAGSNWNAAIIDRNNVVRSWGKGGAVGDGASSDVTSPWIMTTFPVGEVIVDIAITWKTGIAAGVNGSVYTWGDNAYGIKKAIN